MYSAFGGESSGHDQLRACPDRGPPELFLPDGYEQLLGAGCQGEALSEGSGRRMGLRLPKCAEK